jgi:hypothetical protein
MTGSGVAAERPAGLRGVAGNAWGPSLRRYASMRAELVAALEAAAAARLGLGRIAALCGCPSTLYQIH